MKQKKTKNPERQGRLITLEGGEGAGKSTLAHVIAEWLKRRGEAVVLTREPGGSPLAEALREAILKEWPQPVSAETETLLMFAARAAHLEQTVLPALCAGQHVICDRFVDSTYAYQGAGKGVDARRIASLERLVVGKLRPHLVLLLDLPPELGLARTRRRGVQNRFEHETLSFMRRVRRCFLQRARAAPARYAVLDASDRLSAVRQQALKVLEERW